MGKIKVQSVNSTNSMQISVGSSDYAVSVTNNRAQYYSEQAKKYRDEAKTSRDEAKYYAEQNSNVTFEYIEGVKNSLVERINTKQIQGDYALSSDIPTKVSELENDSEFATVAELNQSIAENTIDKSLSDITEAGKEVIRENSYHPSLFQSFWSDHLLNRMDMLRADTFSWQDGISYELAYDELVSEYDNESSVEETEGSITFKCTPKGYKIADSSQEEAILNKYNAEGVAWFYILDKTNTRFKLPRTKWGLVGLRDSVGGYVSESLPNITGTTGYFLTGNQGQQGYWTGAFQESSSSKHSGAHSYTDNRYSVDVVFNASASSSTYQEDAPVQQRATQMYLYFYVGMFAQSALQQTAGLNAELFNSKADINLNNISSSVHAIDGQWVSKEQVLSTAIAAGTYEIDLSDYLPADGYSYEMIITMRSTKGDKSGAFNAYIYSEAIASSIYVGVNSTYSRGQACCVTLPISNSHKMYYVVEATVSDTTVNFRAVGYRRIGTNQ